MWLSGQSEPVATAESVDPAALTFKMVFQAMPLTITLLLMGNSVTDLHLSKKLLIVSSTVPEVEGRSTLA